jgi:acetyl-CoA acetyltransferase
MKPMIGMIVLYRRPHPRPDYFENADQLPAIITSVNSNGSVDIAVFTHANGFPTVQVAAAHFGEGPGLCTWPKFAAAE